MSTWLCVLSSWNWVSPTHSRHRLQCHFRVLPSQLSSVLPPPLERSLGRRQVRRPLSAPTRRRLARSFFRLVYDHMHGYQPIYHEKLRSSPNPSSASNGEVGLNFRRGACGARYLLETRARPDFLLGIDWMHGHQSICHKKNREANANSSRAGSTEREGALGRLGRCSPFSSDARRLRHMNLLVNID